MVTLSKRYSAIWDFWDKAKADDEAYEAFEKALEAQRRGFAESTIDAAQWLKKFHPERLQAFLKDRPGLASVIKTYRKGEAR